MENDPSIVEWTFCYDEVEFEKITTIDLKPGG